MSKNPKEAERCADAEDADKANSETLDYNARSANAAEQAAIVASYQAKAAFWQTFATIGAFVAAGVAVFYANESMRIARETYEAEHRPRLVVKGVDFVSSDSDEIVYTVTNIGTSWGQIIESWIFAEFVVADKYIRNLNHRNGFDLPPHRFEAGESVEFHYKIESMDTFHISKNIDSSQGIFCFTGSIGYVDVRGVSRASVFRRWYDHNRGGFYRMENPDYEYAD